MTPLHWIWRLWPVKTWRLQLLGAALVSVIWIRLIVCIWLDQWSQFRFCVCRGAGLDSEASYINGVLSSIFPCIIKSSNFSKLISKFASSSLINGLSELKLFCHWRHRHILGWRICQWPRCFFINTLPQRPPLRQWMLFPLLLLSLSPTSSLLLLAPQPLQPASIPVRTVLSNA